MGTHNCGRFIRTATGCDIRRLKFISEGAHAARVPDSAARRIESSNLLSGKLPDPAGPRPALPEHVSLGRIIREPTTPNEAASAGFYEHKVTGLRFPKLQLRTVKGLMEGKEIERPSTVAALDDTFKRAPESKKTHATKRSWRVGPIKPDQTKSSYGIQTPSVSEHRACADATVGRRSRYAHHPQ